jgi:hypothetical protein
MTTKRNPYTPYLRNVYVRRIFMLTVFPLWIVLIIPIIAIKSVWEDLGKGISDAIETIKDGNSYD